MRFKTKNTVLKTKVNLEQATSGEGFTCTCESLPTHLRLVGCRMDIRVIDPSAGSPTETLLRLLLPLSNKVHSTFQKKTERTQKFSGPKYSPDCSSVGATGGVYKGQGRNHDELMIHHY